MRLSVIMPVGNIHEYLEAAVISTAKDLPADSELIVAGDKQVISDLQREYPEWKLLNNVRFVISAAGDIVSNLNAAITSASGTYIGRMDSDDLVVEGRFQKQISYLDSHPRAAVVGSYLQYICPHDTNVGVQDYPTRESRNFLGLISPKIAHPAALIRREILEKVGFYSGEYPHVEDLELWLRISRKYELHNIPEKLLKYRLHPNQISRAKSDLQTINGMLAFVNDTRLLSGMSILPTEPFQKMDLADFFEHRKYLIEGMPVIQKTALSIKFQEAFLEKFCLSYLHSKPPKKVLQEFFRGKITKNVREDIERNFAGFLILLLKISTRKLVAEGTPKGRRIAKLRAASTANCALCAR